MWFKLLILQWEPVLLDVKGIDGFQFREVPGFVFPVLQVDDHFDTVLLKYITDQRGIKLRAAIDLVCLHHAETLWKQAVFQNLFVTGHQHQHHQESGAGAQDFRVTVQDLTDFQRCGKCR
jgi:hypothetical protein